MIESNAINYFIDIPEPFGDIIVALRISNIIDQHYTHRSPIIAGCYRVKPLLTRSVPIITN